MEINGAFEYGGYHFIPERQLTSEEKDFASISKRQKLDIDLGFCRENYAYPCKHHYSHYSFYAASPDKTCDLFRCVENGKLYIPCENDLQEYMEYDLDRSVEAFKREARPVLERLLIERFPSTFRKIPESFKEDVLNDVYMDSAWQNEGRFNDEDVSLALQTELMTCVHEIYGRELSVPVREPDPKEQKKNVGDVQAFDSMDVMKMNAWKKYILQYMASSTKPEGKLWMIYDYLARQVRYAERGAKYSHTLLGSLKLLALRSVKTFASSSSFSGTRKPMFKESWNSSSSPSLSSAF